MVHSAIQNRSLSYWECSRHCISRLTIKQAGSIVVDHSLSGRGVTATSESTYQQMGKRSP